jgi:hypothetical protein
MPSPQSTPSTRGRSWPSSAPIRPEFVLTTDAIGLWTRRLGRGARRHSNSAAAVRQILFTQHPLRWMSSAADDAKSVRHSQSAIARFVNDLSMINGFSSPFRIHPLFKKPGGDTLFARPLSIAFRDRWTALYDNEEHQRLRNSAIAEKKHVMFPERLSVGRRGIQSNRHILRNGSKRSLPSQVCAETRAT